jgi:CheY-like chemotaxis protein
LSQILIIDDEETLREMLREILEEEGHTIFLAEDGNQGIEQFQEREIDLVITDIMMPEKNGFEAIRELHGLAPNTKIIALTGFGLHNLPVAYDLGASRVFEKPIAPAVLREAVAELLQE